MKIIENRTYILLTPLPPLCDWINEHDEPHVDYQEIKDHKNLYMIDYFETDDPNEIEKIIESRYEDMFINELWQWYEDEDLFPEDMSFEQFKRFFEWELIDFCYDTLDEGLGYTEV